MHLPDTWEMVSDEYRNFPAFRLDEHVVSSLPAAAPATADALQDVNVDADETLDMDLLQPTVEADDSDADAVREMDRDVDRDDSLSVKKMQSRIRQNVNVLSSFSYRITDSDFLQQLNCAIQQHIECCRKKLKDSGCAFPMQIRRRIVTRKRPFRNLRQRLTAVRRKRRLRKQQQRQRKTGGGR